MKLLKPFHLKVSAPDGILVSSQQLKAGGISHLDGSSKTVQAMVSFELALIDLRSNDEMPGMISSFVLYLL